MALHRTRKREIADPRDVASRKQRVRREGPQVKHVFSAGPAAQPPSRSTAGGVGGGMRIVDMFPGEAQRNSAAPVPKPLSLTGNRIIQATLIAAFMAVLALAHVHLQFAIRDVRLQHQRMQVGYRELLHQQAHLERSTALLKDNKRLQAYAIHDLGMREITERPVALVSRELKEKYDSAAIAREREKTWGQTILARTNTGLRMLAEARFSEWFNLGESAPASDEVR